MAPLLTDLRSQSDLFSERDLFEPLVGLNLWQPRIGFAVMACGLMAGFMLSGARGAAIFLLVIVLVAAGFEGIVRLYRHCRKTVLARGHVVSATIVHKVVTPRGNLHKVVVDTRGHWGTRRSSFFVSFATYRELSIGDRLEIRWLPAGVYWMIPPVPIRRLP